MKTNWNTFGHFALFAQKMPIVMPQKRSVATPEKRPTPTAQERLKPTAPKKLPKKEIIKLKPNTDSMDAMLKSIDADLVLCDKTPKPLQIACLFPAGVFYDKLKSAIAAHIGEVVDEKEAELIICIKAPENLTLREEKAYRISEKHIELLSPESYTPELKRALWEMLQAKGHRR